MTHSAQSLSVSLAAADDEHARQQIALIKSLLVTVHHFSGGFTRLFGTGTDPRHPVYITYPLPSVILELAGPATIMLAQPADFSWETAEPGHRDAERCPEAWSVRSRTCRRDAGELETPRQRGNEMTSPATEILGAGSVVVTALALLPQVAAYADPIPCGTGC